MLHEMFTDIREPSITVGSKKRYTVTMSVIVHAAIAAAVMIIPLVATDVVPVPPTLTVFVSAPVAPPPQPPSTPAKPIAPPATPVQDPSVAPLRAPSGVTPEILDREINTAIPASMDGVFAGVTDGMTDGPGITIPPPSPRASAPPEPVHPGGDIKAPTKIKDVKPTYPAIAQAARVQGVVIIEATIGPDGTVQAATVLRSIPLLDQPALDAVHQWQFTPTLLNGIPVPVIMTVTVKFTLQ